MSSAAVLPAAFVTRRFRAMGTDVELFVAADEGPETAAALDAACAEIDRLERIFTRFDSESELSQLNRAGRLAVSPELLELAGFAVKARLRTAGLVDPTVHDALVAWGYDRTFVEVLDRAVEAPGELPPCGGCVFVDAQAGVVELEPGTRLDFGGLAKGYAADAACAVLSRAGSCIVNAGGDLVVQAPADSPWPVGVDTNAEPLTLNLASGGLATSGADARAWLAGDAEAHHLIDPRTSAPSTSDLHRVTAWGPTALEAEVRSKLLFLLGAEAAQAWAEAEEIPAVLVPRRGSAIRTGWLA